MSRFVDFIVALSICNLTRARVNMYVLYVYLCMCFQHVVRIANKGCKAKDVKIRVSKKRKNAFCGKQRERLGGGTIHNSSLVKKRLQQASRGTDEPARGTATVAVQTANSIPASSAFCPRPDEPSAYGDGIDGARWGMEWPRWGEGPRASRQDALGIVGYCTGIVECCG